MKKGFIFVIMVFIATSAYGFLGYFTDIFSNNGYSSMDVTFIRNIVPILPLLVIMLSVDKGAFRIRLKDAWIFIAIGATKAFADYLLFKSMCLIPISIATVLTLMSTPMVVIFLAMLGKTPATKKKVIAVILCLAGSVLVTDAITGFESMDVLGVAAGLGSALLISVYLMVGEFSTNYGYKPETSLFYSLLVGTLCILPFADIGQIQHGLSNPEVYNSMLMVGFGLTLIPAAIYMAAYKYIDSGTVSIVSIVEIPAAALVGYFLMQQSLTLIQIVGMVVILFALVIMETDFRALIERLKERRSVPLSERKEKNRNERLKENSVLLKNIRAEDLCTVAGILLLFTGAISFWSILEIEEYGVTKACVTSMALCTGGVYYLLMGSRARLHEIDSFEVFSQILGCIGGITLFTGMFTLVYDTHYAGLLMALGGLYLCCSYRLGRGSDLEKRAMFDLFLIVMIFQLSMGIYEMTKSSYETLAICDIITALLCIYLVTDRNIMKKLFASRVPRNKTGMGA